MKKIPFLIAVILLLSSYAAIGIGKEAREIYSISLTFPQPRMETKNIDGETFITINLEDCGILYHSGKPMLPRKYIIKEFPLGTKILDIECKPSSIKTIKLDYPILPAPQPVLLGTNANKAVYQKDNEVYSKDEYYPTNWYSYHLGGGLNKENKRTTFLVIQVYPERYNPIQQNLQIAEDITIKVKYREPSHSLITENTAYDMVIIAPSEFSSILQKLVDHKNNVGIKTILKTTEEIYQEYQGVDKPEQIKYFIKDAIEQWNIKYVLLVGGLKSPIYGKPRDDHNQGSKDWYLPVRYTNLKEMGGVYDPGFISDLYYADIYDSNGNFSSWDNDRHGNRDGIFASWQFGSSKDYLDLYPDVYVGRLPCRNKKEVEIMVDKIISYEKNTYGKPWFKKMIGIGGDSHEDPGTNYCEGEVSCEYVFETYMSNFTPVKLYASYKDTDPEHVPSPENIQREITAGSGFLLFDGHGHPGAWNTHWPGEITWDDTPGGITAYDFFGLKNKDMYPVSVVGGCHNSQFNISLLSTVLKMPFMWTHGYAYAECFSWHLTRKIDGGAIAAMGNTGLGYGTVGENGDIDGDGVDLPDTIEALGGYQIVQFFKNYAEGKVILGETWGNTIRNYLNTYPGMDDQADCKTVEEWPLLGDPSLLIGGYPS